MICPNLDQENALGPVCQLQAGPYLPSEFEFDEFCTTSRHCRCPLFNSDRVTVQNLCQLEVARAVG